MPEETDIKIIIKEQVKKALLEMTMPICVISGEKDEITPSINHYHYDQRMIKENKHAKLESL